MNCSRREVALIVKSAPERVSSLASQTTAIDQHTQFYGLRALRYCASGCCACRHGWSRSSRTMTAATSTATRCLMAVHVTTQSFLDGSAHIQNKTTHETARMRSKLFVLLLNITTGAFAREIRFNVKPYARVCHFDAPAIVSPRIAVWENPVKNHSSGNS